MIGNSSQKIIIKNNFNNNTIDNSRFNKKMKISISTNNIKNNLLINNNKKFQIKKYKLLNGRNSTQNIWYKNTFNENNNIYNSYNGNEFNIILKFPKNNENFNKYKININPPINNVNDILSTDNKIPYINSYSLNSNTYNNGNKMNLTKKLILLN